MEKGGGGGGGEREKKKGGGDVADMGEGGCRECVCERQRGKGNIVENVRETGAERERGRKKVGGGGE